MLEGGERVSGGRKGGEVGECGIVPLSLDVEERVLEAEELVGRHDCGCSVVRLFDSLWCCCGGRDVLFSEVTMC